MEFNELGKMVHDNWIEISKMFSYAELDVFVVMPNHIYGLIKINKPLNDYFDVEAVSKVK